MAANVPYKVQRRKRVRSIALLERVGDTVGRARDPPVPRIAPFAKSDGEQVVDSGARRA
jgi:hypothetical protein